MLNNSGHIKEALERRKEEIVCAITDENNKTYFVTNALVLDFINQQEKEIKYLHQAYSLSQKIYERKCEELETAKNQRKKAYEIIRKVISSNESNKY